MRWKSLRPWRAPLGSVVSLGVFSGRFAISQWVQTPAGASGSSAMRARDLVLAGTSIQVSLGERSAPSQVYFSGILPLLGNAGEVRVKAMGLPSCRLLGSAKWGVGGLGEQEQRRSAAQVRMRRAGGCMRMALLRRGRIVQPRRFEVQGRHESPPMR